MADFLIDEGKNKVEGLKKTEINEALSGKASKQELNEAVQNINQELSSVAKIDDKSISENKTWSSKKINLIENDIENAEEYIYKNVIDKNYKFLSTSQFNPFDYTLKRGTKYKITIKFLDITNQNLTKLRTIRTYSEMTGSALVDEIDFGIDYGSFDENINYFVYYTPSNDCNYILFGFDSSAVFENDNVDFNVEDTTIKFASLNTENQVRQIEETLTKEINIGDIAFTVGFYMKADGTTAENANFEVSDYISVLEGSTVSYRIHSYNNVAMINVYNLSKQVIKTVLSTTEQDLIDTMLLPVNSRFIRICRWSTYKNENDTISFLSIINSVELFNELNDCGRQWRGKQWHCFGTSISNANVEGKYPQYLVNLSGLNYINFAYSGGKITNQILNQIRNDQNIANADLITIEGFVNDWSQQSILGEITDTTEETFFGALYQAITYILSHSNATLILITDTTGQNYNNIDLRRTAERNGKTQNDFINATIEMCNYMGVPVIDAGRKSCINENTASLYLVDQIHQTEKGGEQYAKTIWEELKNISPRIK